jgi:NAD(P)H dehydrogenase (quinone)
VTPEAIARQTLKESKVPQFLNATLGVTGASGLLGRRVIELLLEAGGRHVVALTRSPEKLADLAARGVDVREASFDAPAALPAAFAGIERLLLVSTDALETRRAQQTAAVDAAVAAGVAHLAYTSVTSPYPDAAALVPDSHYWTEVRIAASGLDFSILRNNQYTDYLVPGAQHAIATGTLAHAAGGGRRAFVTREDCAAAAAGALLGAEGRRVYDISGPAALSNDDLAALYSHLFGRAVAAKSVPAEAYFAGLEAAGMPPAMAGVLTRFDTDTARGYLGIATNHVRELTGREPQPVADFLAANRTALAA